VDLHLLKQQLFLLLRGAPDSTTSSVRGIETAASYEATQVFASLPQGVEVVKR